MCDLDSETECFSFATTSHRRGGSQTRPLFDPLFVARATNFLGSLRQ
jgi:hypothetical protein